MRVLITGASGQLSTELAKALTTGQTVSGALSVIYADAEIDAVTHQALDIADRQAVDTWFADHPPYDIVINAAAQTNVDGCEKAEAQAYRVNAHGPENLALAVNRTGGKLIHVSTDYVFAGTEAIPRMENDPVCPVSAYGRTKLAGEKLALDACPRTFVVRTAWLYGAEGKNFVKTMLRLARQNGMTKVVNDQWGSPTNAADLADAILRLAVTDQYGIYHAVNAGVCSWYDFACRIVDQKGIPCEKMPLTSAQYKTMFPASADRPAYSVLSTQKLETVIGQTMRTWQAAIDDFLATNEL